MYSLTSVHSKLVAFYFSTFKGKESSTIKVASLGSLQREGFDFTLTFLILLNKVSVCQLQVPEKLHLDTTGYSTAVDS